jgi:UDP-N-acetyl-D-mannosaminuronic acid dehydrogenase
MTFNALVSKEVRVREAIVLMSSTQKTNFIAGIAVVVDKNRKVLGVLSDGDIRRGLSKGLGIDEPVSAMANFSPITIRHDLSKQQMRKEIIRLAKKRNSDYRRLSKIVLVNDKNEFCDVVWLSDIFDQQIDDKMIAVYGMGFVGLTLAAVFADTGLIVSGIDTNRDIIGELIQGRPHFHENGLESLLLSLSQSNPIHFADSSADFEADVHLICVGTPVDSSSKPDFSAITEVSKAIARKLKKGDLVILRSTLPVGTTRRVVIPILESSGLRVGADFYVAFAPERTVEGNALEELRTLPQIVGGYSRTCTDLAARLFSKITNTIVEVETLEAAEMVKLLNNSFRDLVFSFSNEVASVCDGINVNAFRLISAANEGYPRNAIPAPSPGVGGICLSKDPHLYSNPTVNIPARPILGEASRKINSAGHKYVFDKISKFSLQAGVPLERLKIFIIGLALKGNPETSDVRESTALKLIDILPDKKNIRVKDFVIKTEAIRQLGCEPVNDMLSGFSGCDVALVMNNHYMNGRFNLHEALGLMKSPFLFFDGWNMFNQTEIERVPGAYYATMGYFTDRVGLA